MGEHLVVPAIRSRKIARAQPSGVRRCEDALKALDFGNCLLGVHSVSNIQTWAWQSSNGAPLPR
jgi:hypothetical protein